MSFHIDFREGFVMLPNGCVLSPHLSQDEFRASKWFAAATERDVGTRPFVHYGFSCGDVDGKELLANLIFYDQMLLSIELETAEYAPEARDWSNYSLEVEAATKDFHEILLRRMLGKPTSCTAITHTKCPPSQVTLYQPCRWRFSWGEVGSFHDQKGGATFISIKYGNRVEEANQAYRASKKGTR